jgi:hypothetical protein
MMKANLKTCLKDFYTKTVGKIDPTRVQTVGALCPFFSGFTIARGHPASAIRREGEARRLRPRLTQPNHPVRLAASLTLPNNLFLLKLADFHGMALVQDLKLSELLVRGSQLSLKSLDFALQTADAFLFSGHGLPPFAAGQVWLLPRGKYNLPETLPFYELCRSIT